MSIEIRDLTADDGRAATQLGHVDGGRLIEQTYGHPRHQPAIDRVRAALGEASPVQVEADPAMRPGECCLRSPVGSVELGIEAQLRALRTGLAAAAEGAGS